MSKTEPKEEDQEVVEPKASSDNAKIVTILDTELDLLKAERQEFKDKYLRLLADAENARKRLGKEKQDAAQYLLQDFVSEFLMPIDNMENALAFADQMSDEVRNWAIGFKMILGQLQDALESKGVRPFVSVGEAFDPHLHEAVEMQESNEAKPDIVLEEFSRGYRMGDRVIRPARVKVSKAPKAAAEADQVNEEDSKEGA